MRVVNVKDKAQCEAYLARLCVEVFGRKAGIVPLASFAGTLGILMRQEAAQVLALLQRCGLPSRYPGKLPSPAELTRLIGRDKKKAGKTVDVILPIRPGRCEILPGQQPRELAAVIAATLG